jgi:hypothetical protein
VQEVNIVSESASESQDAKDRLTALVDRMKRSAPFGASIDWESNVWDIANAPTRASKRAHRNKTFLILYCSFDGKNRGAEFEPYFANFAKAFLCHRHDRNAQTPEAHRVALRALRYLYTSMRLARLEALSALRVYNFNEAQALVASREAESSSYRVGRHLEAISEFCDRFQLTNLRIGFHSSLEKPAEAADPKKLVSDDMIDVVGDFSAHIGTQFGSSVSEIVLMRTTDILVAVGFRVGEALTLPLECIVINAEGMWLRYWVEKNGDVALRAVPKAAEELVQRAVDELRAICAPARQMAQWLFENPGRVYLPPATPVTLSLRDIEELLDISNSGARSLMQDAPAQRIGGNVFFGRHDLERALADRRDDRLAIDGASVKQKQHESLIVVFKYEMHVKKKTMRFLVTPVTIQHINRFLESRFPPEIDSEHQGLQDANGLTSHKFRHWLDTLMKRGGLNEFDIARFYGRKKIHDNRYYDHRTTEERAEGVRQLVREGKVGGVIVDAYRACPVQDREHFLLTQVTAALLMPHGGCLHDWAQSPCSLHMNCLTGCDEFYVNKGDVVEIDALIDYRAMVEAARDRARDERLDGAHGAGNYELHQIKILKNIDAAMAIHNDSSIATATLLSLSATENG